MSSPIGRVPGRLNSHGQRPDVADTGGRRQPSAHDPTRAEDLRRTAVRTGTRSRATRERILQAARDELAGSDRLTVRAVAARAGVSRQTIYYHVRGLAGLRAALAPSQGATVTAPADTRERILEAAVRVLSRPGTPAGIDEIAAEAGVTKGAVYHHFVDRRALLRAVAERVTPVDEILAALAATDGLPDREALVVLLRAYHAAIAARAELVRNLVIASSRDPELVATLTEEMVGRGAPSLLGWVAERMARGTLRPVEPALVLQALFGAAWTPIVFGPHLFDAIRRIGGRPVAEVAEDYVDLFLNGLSAGR